MSTEVHHASVRSVRMNNRQQIEVPFAPGTFLAYRCAVGNYRRHEVYGLNHPIAVHFAMTLPFLDRAFDVIFVMAGDNKAGVGHGSFSNAGPLFPISRRAGSASEGNVSSAVR